MKIIKTYIFGHLCSKQLHTPDSKGQWRIADGHRFIFLNSKLGYIIRHKFNTCARIRPYDQQILGSNFDMLKHTKPLFQENKILSVHNLYFRTVTLSLCRSRRQWNELNLLLPIFVFIFVTSVLSSFNPQSHFPDHSEESTEEDCIGSLLWDWWIWESNPWSPAWKYWVDTITPPTHTYHCFMETY